MLVVRSRPQSRWHQRFQQLQNSIHNLPHSEAWMVFLWRRCTTKGNEILLRKPVIILENFTEFWKEEQVHSIEQKACNTVNFLQVAFMLPKKLTVALFLLVKPSRKIESKFIIGKLNTKCSNKSLLTRPLLRRRQVVLQNEGIQVLLYKTPFEKNKEWVN